jgi:hypothetical protein
VASATGFHHSDLGLKQIAKARRSSDHCSRPTLECVINAYDHEVARPQRIPSTALGRADEVSELKRIAAVHVARPLIQIRQRAERSGRR